MTSRGRAVDAKSKLHQRETLVRAAERSLKRAIDNDADQRKVDNCKANLAAAHRALAKAREAASGATRKSTRASGTKTKSGGGGTKNKAKKKPMKTAPKPKAKPSVATAPGGNPDSWVDSGVRYSLDPDAATRTVWVFKTGSTFHRRDCQVVESRDGAIEISIEKARKRNLTRCMHCVPTVR